MSTPEQTPDQATELVQFNMRIPAGIAYVTKLLVKARGVTAGELVTQLLIRELADSNSEWQTAQQQHQDDIARTSAFLDSL